MRACSAPCGLWAGCRESDCQECPQAPEIEPCEPHHGYIVPCGIAVVAGQRLETSPTVAIPSPSRTENRPRTGSGGAR
jgi:hypothetical protein